MTISGYLQEHWSMLVLPVGMGIALSSDIHPERKMVIRIAVANFMMFVYSVTCYAESYLGNQIEYSPMRPILSAFNYSLITVILVTIILILRCKRSQTAFGKPQITDSVFIVSAAMNI